MPIPLLLDKGKRTGGVRQPGQLVAVDCVERTMLSFFLFAHKGLKIELCSPFTSHHIQHYPIYLLIIQATPFASFLPRTYSDNKPSTYMIRIDLVK